MVDRLEKAGLAYRESSEPDARVRWVKLTEEGKRVIRQTETLWAQTLSEPFEQFSEAERQQFLEFMHRLSEALPAKKSVSFSGRYPAGSPMDLIPWIKKNPKGPTRSGNHTSLKKTKKARLPGNQPEFQAAGFLFEGQVWVEGKLRSMKLSASGKCPPK